MKIKLKIAWGDRSEQILLAAAGWSAVAHLIALIGFTLLPRFTTPPPMPRATIAEIIPASALLPLPPAGGPRRAEPNPSERAEAAREAAREAAKQPPPEEKAPPRPKEPARPKKRPDASVPPPPDEKPAARPTPEPEPPAPQGGEEAPAAGAAGPSAGISLGGTVGPGGIPSIGSSAFPYDYYRSILVTQIQTNWRRPVAPEGIDATVSCRVQFTILKNGVIQDARLSAPSGNDALDQSALRAIYDSNPLPPLPFQYGQASVSAEVVFELKPE